jgi:ketosteroid isomerase-like protein
MSVSKSDIVRSIFTAYHARDRGYVERAFADDFTFTSPYDDAIDKSAYFAKCWPVSETVITSNTIERIFVDGDEAFVTYKCLTHDGKSFRNTEFFVFRGDKVRSIDVYFGATYEGGKFISQQLSL